MKHPVDGRYLDYVAYLLTLLLGITNQTQFYSFFLRNSQLFDGSYKTKVSAKAINSYYYPFDLNIFTWKQMPFWSWIAVTKISYRSSDRCAEPLSICGFENSQNCARPLILFCTLWIHSIVVIVHLIIYQFVLLYSKQMSFLLLSKQLNTCHFETWCYS